MYSSSQQSSDPTSSSHQSIHLEENWGAFYDKLVSYKEKYGHCIIPETYEEDSTLAQWAFEQRIKGQEKLDDDKVAKLASISFEWYPAEGSDQVKWQAMYDTLLKYKEEHGDCLVPQRYPDDPKLGRWVNKQRENKDRLLPARRRLLDDIGFTWKVVQREPWDKMLERLVKYRQTNGHCLVPQRYKKDPRLGGWVREQRKRKRLMTVERKRRLDDVDFIWKVKKQDTNKSRDTPHVGEDIIGDAIEDGIDFPEQTSMIVNMNNNGGRGMAALSSQQPIMTAASAASATSTTPLSICLPQNSLGTTIGPAVSVVNPVAASGMIPSMQAQNSLAQRNWILASQQGLTIEQQQANQLASYKMQMLQTGALGLLHGGTPPLSGQLVQQSLATPIAPAGAPSPPRQLVQQPLAIPVAPMVSHFSGRQLVQQPLAIPVAPIAWGVPDLRNIQTFRASPSMATPQTAEPTTAATSAHPSPQADQRKSLTGNENIG